MPPAAPAGRDLRLDFFRGLSLWFIFLDHVPSNVAAWITVRNFGFSDASEIFVFISGYTAAFVYGRVMTDQGFVIGAARILKRAWQIYVAYVFLFVFYLAEISYLSAHLQNPLYSEEFGVFEFFKNPAVILVEALKLRFLPGMMDVLPLYIVLMGFFPLALWALLRFPNTALAVSATFYVTARYLDWNIALYPYDHFWFFNPFTWQFLFVIGGWCALGSMQSIKPVLRSPVFIALSVLFLLFAATLVLGWLIPGFTRKLPNWMQILPLNKTDLSLFRLCHFLLLANLVVRFVPIDAAFLRSIWSRPLILCGANSLEIFCLGVFLSFSAHFLLSEVSRQVLFQLAISLAGILIMIAAAAIMSWYKRIARRGGRSPSSKQEAVGDKVA